MVTIDFKIPAGALESCRKQIEAISATIVADIATKTYNNLLRQEYPYYSGSYISSWNISVGSPDTTFNEPVWKRGVYLAPRQSQGVSLTSPYQKVFISNYTPHATQVEYEGTPKHAGGWHVATSARSNTVSSYKFF